jgi:hypothetical protein
MKMRDLIRLTEMPDVPRMSGRRPAHVAAGPRVLNATGEHEFFATGPNGPEKVATVVTVDDELRYFVNSSVRRMQPHPSLVRWVTTTFAQFLKSGAYAGTPFEPGSNHSAILTMDVYAGQFLIDYCHDEIPHLVHLNDPQAFATDVIRESRVRPSDIVVLPYSADSLFDDDGLNFKAVLDNMNKLAKHLPEQALRHITVPAAYAALQE